jgi:hypothetical protein
MTFLFRSFALSLFSLSLSCGTTWRRRRREGDSPKNQGFQEDQGSEHPRVRRSKGTVEPEYRRSKGTVNPGICRRRRGGDRRHLAGTTRPLRRQLLEKSRARLGGTGQRKVSPSVRVHPLLRASPCPPLPPRASTQPPAGG